MDNLDTLCKPCTGDQLVPRILYSYNCSVLTRLAASTVAPPAAYSGDPPIRHVSLYKAASRRRHPDIRRSKSIGASEGLHS